MRYFLLAGFVLSLIGRALIDLLIERVDGNFWAALMGTPPHDVALERHGREIRKYEDVKVGLTYTSCLSVVMFLVSLTTGS